MDYKHHCSVRKTDLDKKKCLKCYSLSPSFSSSEVATLMKIGPQPFSIDQDPSQIRFWHFGAFDTSWDWYWKRFAAAKLAKASGRFSEDKVWSWDWLWLPVHRMVRTNCDAIALCLGNSKRDKWTVLLMDLREGYCGAWPIKCRQAYKTNKSNCWFSEKLIFRCSGREEKRFSVDIYSVIWPDIWVRQNVWRASQVNCISIS